MFCNIFELIYFKPKTHFMKNLSKFPLVIAIILFLSINVKSQTVQSQGTMFMPLPFGIGFGYELALGNQLSLDITGEFKSYIGDDDFAVDNFVMSPRIGLEGRYYYDLKKRFDSGKNTDNNSANYFALLISEEFPIGYEGIRDYPIYTTRILPKWGMRRTLSQNFTIDFGAYFGVKYGATLKDRDLGGSAIRTYGPNEWKAAYGVYVTLSHVF